MISLEAFREAEHLYRNNKDLFYRKYYYYEQKFQERKKRVNASYKEKWKRSII